MASLADPQSFEFRIEGRMTVSRGLKFRTLITTVSGELPFIAAL
jgi:hypothetical protein